MLAEMRDIETFKGEPWGSCFKKCLMMHSRAARRGGMCHGRRSTGKPSKAARQQSTRTAKQRKGRAI